VNIAFPELPERGIARAVVVDDIASSGATLASAARALRRAGIPTVDALVVHALFAPGALERIRRAGVRRIVSTDSIPHATNALSLAPLLARTLSRAAA
jgi:ribose-phosphate pyrophosphokinase